MIETQNEDAKRILSIEMIARIIKKKIEDENRNQMKLIQIPTQGPFIEIIVHILNQLLNKDDEIWKYIINQLNIKYDISSEQSNQIKQNINIISLIQVNYYLFFFK